MHIESTGNDPYIYCRDVCRVTGPMVLTIRMKSDLNGRGMFFWTDLQNGNFNSKQRISFDIKHDNEFHEYKVTFSAAKPLTAVRIDPGGGKGAVQIRSIQLKRPYGEILNMWNM